MVRKSFIGRLLRDRKGQGLIEYALLAAGIALVCVLGVSLIGEKTGDMLDLVAVVLPGADTDDNAAIQQGHLIEDTGGGQGSPIGLDVTGIQNNAGVGRLGVNLTGQNVGNGATTPLIVDPVIQGGS